MLTVMMGIKQLANVNYLKIFLWNIYSGEWNQDV